MGPTSKGRGGDGNGLEGGGRGGGEGRGRRKGGGRRYNLFVTAPSTHSCRRLCLLRIFVVLIKKHGAENITRNIFC